MNSITQKTWHFDHWPFLAWVETVIKFSAFLVALVTIIRLLPGLPLSAPIGKTTILSIIQGILSMGLIAAIFDRLKEKEIIAMGFVVFNNLAHWSALILLFSKQPPISALQLFWLLMLIGDLVKILFLYAHNFTVRNTPRAAMFGLTGFYILGYGLLLLISVTS